MEVINYKEQISTSPYHDAVERDIGYVCFSCHAEFTLVNPGKSFGHPNEGAGEIVICKNCLKEAAEAFFLLDIRGEDEIRKRIAYYQNVMFTIANDVEDYQNDITWKNLNQRIKALYWVLKSPTEV
jgi:predicted RNA-binding Zn-ribbon protein involved in translation (DUF1610 family)